MCCEYSIARIRKKILQIDSIEPFYLHTFHSTTKPNDFLDSSTIIYSKIESKSGRLTSAITKGNVFIADNISSVENMFFVNPILEHIFNTNIIMRGLQEEMNDKMKIKTRKIIYPNQNEEEVENICSQINSALYIGDINEKLQLSEKEVRACGRFMLRVNEKGILPQRWSLRDISKIFMNKKPKDQWKVLL